jgi:hypothetical protein
MKLNSRIASSLLSAFCWLMMASLPFLSVEADEPAEGASQQELMNSPRWKQAKLKFDEWLAIQTVYNEDEVVALKSELRNRIATMSTPELQNFLEEMETKVAILLSPDTMDARRWVDKYTEKEQQKILKKFGVQDPMRISAIEMESVLRQFTAERASKRASSAAFNRSRESQAKAVKDYRRAQSTQVSAARTAASQRRPSRSPYAPKNTPRRPQTYTAPYHKMNYSVGPWGGIRVNPSRR